MTTAYRSRGFRMNSVSKSPGPSPKGSRKSHSSFVTELFAISANRDSAIDHKGKAGAWHAASGRIHSAHHAGDPGQRVALR